MTYSDRPPDDWNDDGPGPPLRKPLPKKIQGDLEDRPHLDASAERLRSGWIAAVRDFHQRRSGSPSKYNSDPQWDGGRKVSRTAKNGCTTWKPVWPKLVDRLLSGGVHDPLDAIRSLFSSWYSDSAPTPYAITTPGNIEAARNLRQNRLRRIAMARTAEEGVFRMAAWAAGLTTPDTNAAISYVLNDVGRELSPLFRYSLAVLKGLPEVAARWRNAAETQFRQDPGSYLTYWSSLLPADLQQATPAGNVV